MWNLLKLLVGGQVDERRGAHRSHDDIEDQDHTKPDDVPNKTLKLKLKVCLQVQPVDLSLTSYWGSR